MQRRAARRRQTTDGQLGERQRLESVEQLLEDRRVVVIETRNDAGQHRDAVTDHRLHRALQGHQQVLLLAGLAQALRIERLDADEHRRQPGGETGIQQIGVARDIDRALGGELHLAVLARVVPFGDCRQDGVGALAVDGEIVVDQKDSPAAGGVQLVDLGDDLLDALEALLAPLILDDVAELAIERAAARCLHGARLRPIERVEVPARQRRQPDVGLTAVVVGRPRARCEVGERRGQLLALIRSDQESVARKPGVLRFCVRKRPPGWRCGCSAIRLRCCGTSACDGRFFQVGVELRCRCVDLIILGIPYPVLESHRKRRLPSLANIKITFIRYHP